MQIRLIITSDLKYISKIKLVKLNNELKEKMERFDRHTCTANWMCSGPTVFARTALLVDGSCEAFDFSAASIAFLELSGCPSEM